MFVIVASLMEGAALGFVFWQGLAVGLLGADTTAGCVDGL